MASSGRAGRATMMTRPWRACWRRCCRAAQRRHALDPTRRGGGHRDFEEYGAAPFRLFGVHPHRSKTFKLSTDPLFVEKVRDIVGLYLNPPDHAVVLCVDEKSQIQALERTQPVLPMGFGYVDGITHDYKRHGTTTLFAALDVANGQVLAQCKARHRHQEFLAFLKRIDAAVPARLDVHLIVDNYATHKHPKVRAWLRIAPPELKPIALTSPA